MLKLSQYSLVASVVLVTLALICYIAVMALQRTARTERSKVLVAAGGVPAGGELAEPPRARASGAPTGLVLYGVYFSRLAALILTASLVFRTLATGHGPFAHQYEFAIAFGWGVLLAFSYFEWRYRVRMLALLVLPIAGALLLYAMTVGSTAVPLVPALQNNLLLTVHIVVAILAYGAFSVACAAGVLYLIHPYVRWRAMPRPELLDEIGYRAVVIAFPLMTLTIIFGAVWADIAWGTYWSWDPKETASLVTWLIYGAYLHARVVRGWRGQRAAWLLMAGFGAVLFTFFGNLFFGGLHSYAGVNGNG